MNPPDTDGRSTRAREQREIRRNQILDTALQVFSTKGYHRTTIRDVVKAAGVARGTFYLYFDSKDAIFHELLDRLLAHLRANVVGVDLGSGAPPVRDQLLETVDRVLRTVDANRAFTRILLREAVGLDASIDHKLDRFYGNLHSFTRDALEMGQRLRVIRDDLDTEIASACILGSIKQVLEQYFVNDDRPIDATSLSRAVLDYNLRGVLQA